MAKSKTEILVTQSLLDRLVDGESWPDTREKSIRMYRDSLKRDVEWLLNTRQPVIPEIDRYPLAAASVLNFGLPNLQDLNGYAGSDHNAVALAIERCLQTFESRIKRPRVYLVRADTLNRSLKFLIEGLVSYEDTEEEIKFDTVLELLSGEYVVK